jgi:hypothetical protein
VFGSAENKGTYEWHTLVLYERNNILSDSLHEFHSDAYVDLLSPNIGLYRFAGPNSLILGY